MFEDGGQLSSLVRKRRRKGRRFKNAVKPREVAIKKLFLAIAVKVG